MTRIASFETTRQDSVIKVVGSLCVLSAPYWIYNLFFPFPFNSPLQIENDLSSLLLVLAIAAALQVMLISKLTIGDHFLTEVMMVGFLLKLAAISAYIFTVVHVYDNTGDCFYYFGIAIDIVNKHSLTGEWTSLRPFWSTNFIIMLTSWLIFVFGRSFQGIMLVFAVISYWGQYLFYRAFRIAFPTQEYRGAALLMFFLPSIVFWTAMIGKDSVIFFFIGACCYGFARMTQSNSAAGLVTTLVSLGGVMLVRPHIAGMLIISLGGAYLLTRNQSGALGMAAKSIGIPALLLASVYFISQAGTFVDLRDVGQIRRVLEDAGEVNLQAPGTTFGSSLTSRLLAAPLLLFRPLPWEVRNPQMVISTVEVICLMIFFWRRRKAAKPSLQRCRENAFFLFLWIYLLEFSLLFAGAMTNFGLLARERVMLVPLALMIFMSKPLPDIEHLRATEPSDFPRSAYQSFTPRTQQELF